jgi:DNA-binding MarR family transcriptional regulator
MVDNNKLEFPTQNIRSLLNEISVAIDKNLQSQRLGSRYEGVRDSDVKVFMRAFRSEETVSEIARSLNVTRQAVHASVQRLMELKVLALQAMPNNSRDKLVVVTERGRHAQQVSLDHILSLENHMAAVIGEKELKTLRKHLHMIAQSFKPLA